MSVFNTALSVSVTLLRRKKGAWVTQAKASSAPSPAALCPGIHRQRPSWQVGEGHTDCQKTRPNTSGWTERSRGHVAKPSPVEKHRCRLCETCRYRSEKLLKVNYSFFFFFPSSSFLFHSCQVFSKVNSTVPYGPAWDESLVLYV